MDDLNFEYLKDKPIKVSFLIDIRDYVRDYPLKEAWFVLASWFDEDYLGGKDNIVSMVINDETGIAVFFNSHTGHPRFRLKIDSNGKYY